MKVCPATNILEMPQHVGCGVILAAQQGSRQCKYLIWVSWALKQVVLLTKEENSICIHQWPQFQKRALAGHLLQHILVGNYSCGCPTEAWEAEGIPQHRGRKAGRRPCPGALRCRHTRGAQMLPKCQRLRTLALSAALKTCSHLQMKSM